MAATFDRDHVWDRNFYLLLVSLSWIGIVMGFGIDIQRHVAKSGFHYPTIVHMHAFLFVGWMVLLTAQVLLIRLKRYGIHRTLGLVLVGWAAAMAIVGPVTAWIMEKAALHTPDADPGFLAIQFGDILIFATLVIAAVLSRRLPSAHKRLILLATFDLTNAGFARWLGGDIFHLLGQGFIQMWMVADFGSTLLIVLLGLYDLVTRRRLHPAYIAGVIWLVAIQLVCIWLYLNPAWGPMARQILGG